MGEDEPEDRRGMLSRRGLLRTGIVTGAVLPMAGARALGADTHGHGAHGYGGHGGGLHGGMPTVGQVDPARNGFDPTGMLPDCDGGRESKLPDGRTLREFDIVAVDKVIEIAPRLFFAAWTYNGRVPGPTIRVGEGD